MELLLVAAGWRVDLAVGLDGCGRVGLDVDAMLRNAIVALDGTWLGHLVHGWARGAERRWDCWRPWLAIDTALHEHLELASSTVRDRRDSVIAIGCTQRPSLGDTDLVLRGSEDATSCCLLLEHLLLVRVGETDLNEVLLAVGLGHWGIVELLDDLVTDLASLEAGKADAAGISSLITEDPARANLVWREDRCEFLKASQSPEVKFEASMVTYMLVHVLGNVRHIEVGIAVIGELLELGVE